MRTHNICFCEEMNNINTFLLEKRAFTGANFLSFLQQNISCEYSFEVSQ